MIRVAQHEVAMHSDGAYADANWRPGEAHIGVVLVVNGKVTDRTSAAMPDCPCPNDAEIAAVELAKDLYPGVLVFTDSQHASRECGVFWIPRAQNREAHAAARRSWQKTQVDERVIEKKAKKLKKKFRFRGRGVVPLEKKRLAFG